MIIKELSGCPGSKGLTLLAEILDVDLSILAHLGILIWDQTKTTEVQLSSDHQTLMEKPAKWMTLFPKSIV